MLTNLYPKLMGGMFIHNQVKYLLNAGCEAKVVVPVPYAPKYLRGKERWKVYADIPERDTIDNVSVYYPRYLRPPGRWFHSLSCYSQYLAANNIVRSLISEFKPDILHAHAATAPGYLGLLINTTHKLPLVCSLRGSDINSYPFYDRFSLYLTKNLISRADRLVSVSSALKKATEAIERPNQEIKVIYNGCDINTFIFRQKDRHQIRNELGISDKEHVLIFVGSISKDKGIFELLDAFSRLYSTNINVHLVIIGNGPDRSSIQSIVLSDKIRNNVHIIGKLPNHVIPKYLSASDVFILPSYSEGLPNVVLEAMSCSLPVIASSVGGIPEAVVDGKSGILVEKKNADSLKIAIEYVIYNTKKAKEMGINGRKIVENKFTWPRNAEEVIQVYKELIRNNN